MGPAAAMAAGQAFKTGGEIFGILAEAAEFNRQINAQNSLLSNTAEMVLIQRDSVLFDLKKRSNIIAGSVVARAGKAGVTVSGSVINQVADVAAMTAVERLRININAENAVNVINFQKKELTRQGRQKTKNAIISSAFKLGQGATGGG